MKVAGIVAEYNPFHNGHHYQIVETKRLLNVDYVIVIMSGNYVQRGEPAIFDKWTRTQLALQGGADLVIELPTPYACSSAETFAYGSINLLGQLGVVDFLSFGSELGSLESLKKIARFLVNENDVFKATLKDKLKSGHSYPKARSLALLNSFPNDFDILKGSNNILGIEYLKALEFFHYPIEPITVKRIGSSYLDEEIHASFPSATALRLFIKSNQSSSDSLLSTLRNSMPPETFNSLNILLKESTTPIFMEHLYPFFRYQLTNSTDETIAKVYDFPLDLYHRLRTSGINNDNFNDFIEEGLSKNYTKTTLNRSLLHQFLDLKKDDLQGFKESNFNHYIRVLGFKKSAAPLLHTIKKKGLLPLVTNVKDHQYNLSTMGKSMLQNEIRYSILYNQLISMRYQVNKKDDYRQPIIIL